MKLKTQSSGSKDDGIDCDYDACPTTSAELLSVESSIYSRGSKELCATDAKQGAEGMSDEAAYMNFLMSHPEMDSAGRLVKDSWFAACAYARAEERKRCAEVAKSKSIEFSNDVPDSAWSFVLDCGDFIAKAIEQRG